MKSCFQFGEWKLDTPLPIKGKPDPMSYAQKMSANACYRYLHALFTANVSAKINTPVIDFVSTPDKFENDLHIILNDDRSNKLYIFKLPPKSITNPSSHFKQRNDKYRANCSDIYISIMGTLFREKNGFDFTKFLIEKIGYSS